MAQPKDFTKKEKKEFYIIKVLNIFYNSKQCLHEISTTWSYEIHVQSIVTLKKSLNIASLTCKYSLKKGSFLLGGGGRGVVPIEIEHWIQDLHTNHLFIYLFIWEKKICFTFTFWSADKAITVSVILQAMIKQWYRGWGSSAKFKN